VELRRIDANSILSFRNSVRRNSDIRSIGAISFLFSQTLFDERSYGRMRVIRPPSPDIRYATIALLDRDKERSGAVNFTIAVPTSFDAPIGAFVGGDEGR
jgi:hypothetical protein